MPDRLLTTAEVAEVLRVHPKHVYRLLKQGLPARRVGAEWRFSSDEVLAWSSHRGRSAAPEPRREGPLAGPDAPPSLVATTGDVAVLALLKLAASLGPPLIGFVQADLRAAAELLRQRAVLAAGAHAGSFPSQVGEERVARIHLVRREVGLLRPRGTPPVKLKDLGRKRLASRPGSAGVRAYLDEALRAAGVDPVRGYRTALELASHLDVVLAVVSGRAEVGLASRAWGARAGLAFQPLGQEDYGLVVRARDLGDPRVVRLCEVAQGRRFRDEVGGIPGYETAGAGEVRSDA
jgi:excisionase family DNA binding protein